MSTQAPSRIEMLGRYRILDELGRGAVGLVYRAEDTVIERVVALKTVPRPGPTSASHEHEAFARFLREARAAGKFHHPNVVIIFDVGEDIPAGISYIAMELVEGEPLDRVLKRKEALDFARIRAIGIQVASALVAAHSQGVIHRDIKPANLILTPSGQVKVTDFGIAKIINASMTQDGSLLGSPSYMSPEQVRAAEVDERSDLFSLGIVLYELATLKPAFPGRNVYDVISRVAAGNVRAPREVRPEIPEDLERVILRAMTKDKVERFQTAAEMLAALTEPIAAPLPPDTARAAPSPARAVLRRTLTSDTAKLEAAPASAVTPATPESRSEDVAPEEQPTAAAAGQPTAAAAGQPTAAAAALEAPPTAAASSASAPARAPMPPAATRSRRAWLAAAVLSGVAAAAGLHAWRSGPEPPPAPAITEVLPIDTAAMSLLSPCDLVTTEGRPANSQPAARALDPGRLRRASTSLEAAAQPQAERSPARQPEPAGAGEGVAIAHTVAVEHDHRIGACRGTLTFFTDRVVYDSTDRDKDDRAWPLAALRSFKAGSDAADLVVLENGTERRYRFRILGELAPAAVSRLGEQLAAR